MAESTGRSGRNASQADVKQGLPQSGCGKVEFSRLGRGRGDFGLRNPEIRKLSRLPQSADDSGQAKILTASAIQEQSATPDGLTNLLNPPNRAISTSAVLMASDQIILARPQGRREPEQVLRQGPQPERQWEQLLDRQQRLDASS